MPPAAGHATRTFPTSSRPATGAGGEFGPVDWDSCFSACTSREAMRGCTACVGCGSVTTRTYSSHPERMPQGCRGGCGLSAAGCAVKATARTDVGARALMLAVTRRQRHHPPKTATHCCFAVKFRLRHGQRLRGLQQPLQHRVGTQTAACCCLATPVGASAASASKEPSACSNETVLWVSTCST